jgi:N-ethylmaleimide reductase
VAGLAPHHRRGARAGGRIVVQLWHVGRISHSRCSPAGRRRWRPRGRQRQRPTSPKAASRPCSPPRALRTDELPGIVQAYRAAARGAMAAGFDGVEMHGANGYLLDQFLRRGSNHRTDAYGGPIEHRAACCWR